jgi:hypothetical protein
MPFVSVFDGVTVQVAEDLSYAVMLRRKFGYLESIPGVLLPHPSSAGAFPGGCGMGPLPPPDLAAWPGLMPPHAGPMDLYDPYVAVGPSAAASMHIMPSMSSLEALLSKLPSVVPAPPPQPHQPTQPATGTSSSAKEEVDEYAQQCHHGMEGVPSSNGGGGGESASPATAPMSSYFVDVGGKPGDEGF